MNLHSIYVDRQLFPTVSELSVLDASEIFESRLRGANEKYAIRLDIYYVAWDGDSILGTDSTYLIGWKLPPHKGATRLRHALGAHMAYFKYMVCDPNEPNVVSLIGLSPVPTKYSEELKLTPLFELIEPAKFVELNSVTKAVTAMMRYMQFFEFASQGCTRLMDFENGWLLECVAPLGEAPSFFLRENSPSQLQDHTEVVL